MLIFYEKGKSDKIQGMSSILSLFCNEFNKFNNSGARVEYSIYHMTLSFLLNLISGIKGYHFVIVMDVITFPENL